MINRKEITKNNSKWKISKKIVRSIVYFFVIFLIFNSIYLWYNRGNSSGFGFERLATLVTGLKCHNWKYTIKSYEQYMFAPYILSTLHLSTGLDIVDTFFLPISPILAYFALLLFSHTILQKKEAYLVSISIALTVFASTPHFMEYIFGRILFLFFVYSIFCLFKSSDPRFGALTLLFYIGTKFYGPPMEGWALTFVIFLEVLLLIWTTRNTSMKQLRYHGLVLLFAVIWISYNPKLYENLLGSKMSYTVLVLNLKNFLLLAIRPKAEVPEPFTTIITTPMHVRVVNTLYTILIVLPIILKFVIDIQKKRLPFWANNFRDLFALVLLVTYSFDFVLYGSIGAVTWLRYPLIVFPVVSTYYLAKLTDTRKKIVTFFLSIMIGLAGSSYAMRVAYDLQRPFAGTENIQEVTSWLGEHSHVGISIMTDHNTYGSVRTFFGKIYYNPDYFTFVTYTSDRYGYIVMEKTYNAIHTVKFEYLLINLKTLEWPIVQGPPVWRSFEPLATYYPRVSINPTLDRIYVSGAFNVYYNIYYNTPEVSY